MTGTRSALKVGPELDALVLELVMGWRWVPLDRADGSGSQLLWNPGWGAPRGDDFRVLAAEHLLPWDAPSPSIDALAAGDVEEEIGRRRLQYPYMVALTAMLLGASRKQQDWRDAWAAARATPEQRCRAALRAVGLTIEDEPPSRPTRNSHARPRMTIACDPD